jgi:hypothetical protein
MALAPVLQLGQFAFRAPTMPAGNRLFRRTSRQAEAMDRGTEAPRGLVDAVVLTGAVGTKERASELRGNLAAMLERPYKGKGRRIPAIFPCK